MPRKHYDGPRLPNGPLREAFQRDGRTAAEVCRALDAAGGDGWIYLGEDGRKKRGANTTRLKRALGVTPHGSDHAYYTSSLPQAWAEEIAAVLGIELLDLYPVELAPAKAATCASPDCDEPLQVGGRGRICGFCIEERELGMVAA